MSTTLVPTNRIAALLKEATPAAPEHDPFGIMHADQSSQLPLMSLRLPECRHAKPCRPCRQAHRRMIVGAYDESIKRIHQLRDQIQGMFDGLAEAYVWPGEGDPTQKLRWQMVEEVRRRLSLKDFRDPDVLYAELMAREDTEILTILCDGLQDAVGWVIASFKETLRRLRSQELIGTITWFASDVCKYDFYRARRSQVKAGDHTEVSTEVVEKRGRNNWGGKWEEYEVTTRTVRHVTGDVIEHHEHHLYNAARHPYPASHMRMPRLVQQFIPRIAPCAQPHLFVVEGDMLREEMGRYQTNVSCDEKREVTRKLIRVGKLYSPAVTIGDYVLTGWSKADL